MKRILFILMLGAMSAGGSYYGWIAYRNPCLGDGLDCQLEWMRRELQLSPEQYAAVRSIHESSTGRLTSLSSQVAAMRQEFAEFERARSTSGQVDFLEFARFVENRRAISQQCEESTADIVTRIASVMNDDQRSRYLALLQTSASSAHANRLN